MKAGKMRMSLLSLKAAHARKCYLKLLYLMVWPKEANICIWEACYGNIHCRIGWVILYHPLPFWLPSQHVWPIKSPPSLNGTHARIPLECTFDFLQVYWTQSNLLEHKIPQQKFKMVKNQHFEDLGFYFSRC